MRHCKDYKIDSYSYDLQRHDGTCSPVALRLPTPGLGNRKRKLSYPPSP
ncbi:unnamed protein product [Staurois parvus]|uniref:Uncharacterized protein n=1 Tax=Staurois parvus TaxID=386267 RepID=A0ABN9D525_9NEOB|nr:unnamed protein product [Staurois parvus]